MNINKPFETFEKTAFRLEALPTYIVENEKQAVETFKTTGQLIKNDASRWADIVADNVGMGKSMKRLRLLSDELTVYEQYELQAYPGIQHGEDIRVNARSSYAKEYLYDFWFFDDAYIAQMQYEPDGTFMHMDIRTASNEEKHMLEYWLSIFNQSTKLQ